MGSHEVSALRISDEAGARPVRFRPADRRGRSLEHAARLGWRSKKTATSRCARACELDRPADGARRESIIAGGLDRDRRRRRGSTKTLGSCRKSFADAGHSHRRRRRDSARPVFTAWRDSAQGNRLGGATRLAACSVIIRRALGQGVERSFSSSGAFGEPDLWRDLLIENGLLVEGSKA